MFAMKQLFAFLRLIDRCFPTWWLFSQIDFSRAQCFSTGETVPTEHLAMSGLLILITGECYPLPSQRPSHAPVHTSSFTHHLRKGGQRAIQTSQTPLLTITYQASPDSFLENGRTGLYTHSVIEISNFQNVFNIGYSICHS